MSEILMPQLSSSMEQGTILTWLKGTGDEVQIGDEILEIETDKSTVTYAAEQAGVLQTLIEEGETVAVGTLIAQIGDGPVAAPQAAEPAAPTETAGPSAAAGGRAAAADHTAAGGHAAGAGPVAAARTAVAAAGRAPAATPLARRAAALHGVPLEAVTGTGRLGRITRSDVLAHAGVTASDESSLPTLRPVTVAGAAPASAAPIENLLLPGSRVQQQSRLQQLIASRMVLAKAAVPHFQVQTEVQMNAAVALRAELKALAAEGETVPSLNDFIIKAAALALREHPLVNASFHEDGFVLHDQVNVGIAVAAAEALIVPAVVDADGKSLAQIARDTRTLALKARDGQITPAELEHGTFTVSNLGMFGMTAIAPVINPPQAAILGVGALRETLARVDGEIVDRTLMTLTLSCDHRILYGADAARFLAHIRELLELPLKLAL